MEAYLTEYLDHELRRIAEGAPFDFLARNGDAIEERIRACLREAEDLNSAAFPGAALMRATTGIEVGIRFFLVRPLLQGAFLSNDWAQALTERIIGRRTAGDRALLPAILKNWSIDLESFSLASGRPLWKTINEHVWPVRNRYVHQGDTVAIADADLAIASLRTLVDDLVATVARRLGFTRDETNRWSVVLVENPPGFPDLNPPREYERESPFL